MTGENEMKLNQATMNAAIQHWLNTEVFGVGVDITVIDVEAEGSNEFIVRFEPSKPGKTTV